jgi:uncharacterized protein (TIGR03435 family)
MRAITIWGLLAGSLAAAPAFEVAAIRAASLPTPETMRSGQFRTGLRLNGGSLDWGFASLADLLAYAFRVKQYQVTGPEWMGQSRWNIMAKLPQGAAQEQAPEMMQALLVERFKLTYHREQREQPVYELSVAKGGPKLEVSTEPDSSTPPAAGANAPGLFPGPFGGQFGRGPGNPQEAPDGRGGRDGGIVTSGPNGTTARISPGDGCGMHLELSKLTMQDLTETLSPFLDKPVVDATGLKGSYNATLDLPIEVMFSMMQNMVRTLGLPGPGQGGFGGPGGPGGGPGGGRGPGDGPPGGRGFAGCPDPGAALASGSDASNAPIFQAVQKLGLKLQARKAPFDTIVVDHLERTPSEN